MMPLKPPNMHKSVKALAVTGNMEIAGIEALIPIVQFRGLAHVDAGDDAKQITGTFSFANIVEHMGFNLTVRLGAGAGTIKWPSRFAQISDTIYKKTRSLILLLPLMKLFQKPSPACVHR